MIRDCDAKFSVSQLLTCDLPGNGTLWDSKRLTDGRSVQKKILIDIDGNTFSRRFPYYLLCGSAVFKIAVFEVIGTALGQPWDHFVPINMDISDL